MKRHVDEAPAVAVGVFAIAALVLYSPGTMADTGIEWQAEPLEVATGEAFQGVWRMNDSDFRYVDAPSVALDDDGIASIVWVDQEAQDVYFQRYTRAGEALLTEPVNVSGSGDIFSWLPRVLVARDNPDTVYVAWQEIIFAGGSHGGDILFARSTDGGDSFSDPVNLSDTEAGAGKGRLDRQRWDNGSLDLAEGPDGTLYVAWTEYEGALRVARSDDGGAAFADPVHVAGDDAAPARGPSLAAGHDRVHLVWTVGEDPAGDIRHAVSTDGGASFREPESVAATDGHADAPQVAVDADGVLHLVYAESADGPWQPAEIHYTRRDGDGRFGDARVIGEGHAREYDSLGFPAVAVAGSSVHVLWELFPEQGQRSRGLGMTVSADGGDSFAAADVVPHTADPELGINGSLQGLLMRKLAVNDQGDIAVANSSFLPEERSRVRLIRGRVPGGR